MTKRLCVSLFDHTGNQLKPWHEAGYVCLIVDRQHPAGLTLRTDGIWCLNADLMRPLQIPEVLASLPVAFTCAFPPCDHLAVSGARWFKGKGLRKLSDSISMFATDAEFCESAGAPYFIENPVSTIGTYWREHDFKFHPHWFTGYCGDDNYTKTTCLWVGHGFTMPEQFKLEGVPPPDNRIHQAPDTKNRSNFRNATPMGWSIATYYANRTHQ